MSVVDADPPAHGHPRTRGRGRLRTRRGLRRERSPARDGAPRTHRPEPVPVAEFVPPALDERGGFAGFHETATTNHSLFDRIRALALPRLDVARTAWSATSAPRNEPRLDQKVVRTYGPVDETVYRRYGLGDEEIEIVEEAVAD